MVPTLEVGDVVIVTVYSYGWRPLAYGNVLALHKNGLLLEPHRGDVVVVRNPAAWDQAADALLIKRVIGLPVRKLRSSQGVGDRFWSVDLQLMGPATSRSDPALARGVGGWYLRETLPNDARNTAHRPAKYFICGSGATPSDDFGPITVPKGHLFLLGDNRDGSTDSRSHRVGVVPIDDRTSAVHCSELVPRCRRPSKQVQPVALIAFFETHTMTMASSSSLACQKD